MRTTFLIPLLLLPAMALAQQYNNSPMLISGTSSTPAPAAAATTPHATPAANAASIPAIPAVPANFPDWAVSNAAQNTAGNTNPTPANPANPATPANPANGGASIAPTNPTSPAAPESPISKLWPRDTVPIFVKSCIGFHVELVPQCTCVITTLMATMPHDEFLRESADGSVENDPRLIKARQQCIATPNRQ